VVTTTVAAVIGRNILVRFLHAISAKFDVYALYRRGKGTTLFTMTQGVLLRVLTINNHFSSLFYQKKMFVFRQDTKTLPEHRITDIRAAL
jgi:hypothetical protein